MARETRHYGRYPLDDQGCVHPFGIAARAGREARPQARWPRRFNRVYCEFADRLRTGSWGLMMRGDDLLKEFERRIMKQKNTKSVSDAVLAATIGVTQPQLSNYRGKKLTPRQIVNLVEKYSKATERRFVDSTVVPIV